MNRKRFLVDRAGTLRTTSKARRRNHLRWLEAPEGLEPRLVLSGPDLGIADAVQTANYTVGQTVTYTITVQNGTSADPILLGLPITMTDLAALGLSNVTASAPSGWSFTNSSSTSPSLITGTYTGAYPIAAGATLPVITVTGVANGAALGLVLNTSTVTVLGDLNLANNTASVDVGISNALSTSSLNVSPSTGTYGGTTNVSATLNSLALPVPNEMVDFHLGATDLGMATTNALGVATLPNVSLGAINAGAYTGDITASFAGDMVYSSSSGSADLNVSKAPLTVTATPSTKIYGQANPTFTTTDSGFVLGQNSSALGGSLSFSTLATASSHVGNFAVTPSGLTSSNYSIGYVPANLSVTAAPLTITANNLTKLYGAALPTLTASYTGLVNGDTASNLAVAPTLTSTATAASHVAGGPYTITASGAVDSDYTISYVAGTLSVTAAPLTVTANSLSKVYGAALPTLTAAYTGLVNGDTSASLATRPTLSSTATAASHVSGGPYAVTASGAVDSDYTISYVPGTLAVTAAPLTVAANSLSKVYGAALPTLTTSYTGLVNGDTAASMTVPPTVTTTATSASHVLGGPYAVTASGATDSDYTISYLAGNLSVTAAPLTISANNQSKAYGAALPTLTAAYTGLVNGDTAASLTTPPILTTAATSASHIASGPFAITASGALDSDYAISYAPGTLSITAAPLTITADNLSKVYGAALPTLTASYSGLVNGDTASSLATPAVLSTTATSASHVTGGPYAITASGASDPDYSINVVPGSLTVTSAPLTVTADDQSSIYGAALPTLTASYSGLVNGDTVSSLATPAIVTTAATSASHVVGSPYAITVSGVTDPDYTISYAPGNLSIAPTTLTITADSLSKVYGAALPTLTASYSGFVNGDTSANLTTQPTLSTVATSASHVASGPYVVTASGAVDPDYSISYAPGSLSVTKAPLTIAGDSLSKVYGAAAPTLTASYTGLVNGDTASSLTTPASLTSSVSSASHVGSYPVAVSGATSSDYTINTTNGSVSVTPAPLTVTPASLTKGYGLAIPTLTSTYSGFVNGDTAANLTTPVVLATTGRAVSLPGNYPITASGVTSPDYTVSYGPGTMTVTVTASQAAEIAFVTALYQDIVHRAPDLPGLATFVADLDLGQTKLSVTQTVYNSQEAAAIRSAAGTVANPMAAQQIDLIIALYMDVLGRAPEPSGVDSFLAKFAGGESAAQVASEVQDSAEAIADRANPPTPGYGIPTDLVNALYLNMLGRPVDGPGLSGWLSKLSGGENAAQVAQEIFASPEAMSYRSASEFVSILYSDLLHRFPDPNGLSSFVTALNSGVSKLAVTQTIYNSPEAAAIRSAAGTATSPLGPQEVDMVIALYRDVLGRAPEPSGLDSFLAKIAAGETAPQVASEIQNSAEAIADRAHPPTPDLGVPTDLVEALYEDILNRPADLPGLNSWLTKLANGETPAQVAQDIYNTPEAIADRS